MFGQLPEDGRSRLEPREQTGENATSTRCIGCITLRNTSNTYGAVGWSVDSDEVLADVKRLLAVKRRLKRA